MFLGSTAMKGRHGRGFAQRGDGGALLRDSGPQQGPEFGFLLFFLFTPPIFGRPGGTW